MDVRGQHQARRSDGPLQVLGRARRRFGHACAGLGQEVLDDDLLDVAVAGVRAGDGVQGGHLALPVVADADEDAGREGDGQLARGLQRG